MDRNTSSKIESISKAFDTLRLEQLDFAYTIFDSEGELIAASSDHRNSTLHYSLAEFYHVIEQFMELNIKSLNNREKNYLILTSDWLKFQKNNSQFYLIYDRHGFLIIISTSSKLLNVEEMLNKYIIKFLNR